RPLERIAALARELTLGGFTLNLKEEIANLTASFVAQLNEAIDTSLYPTGFIEHEAHLEDYAANHGNPFFANNTALSDLLGRHANESSSSSTRQAWWMYCRREVLEIDLDLSALRDAWAARHKDGFLFANSNVRQFYPETPNLPA